MTVSNSNRSNRGHPCSLCGFWTNDMLPTQTPCACQPPCVSPHDLSSSSESIALTIGISEAWLTNKVSPFFNGYSTAPDWLFSDELFSVVIGVRLENMLIGFWIESYRESVCWCPPAPSSILFCLSVISSSVGPCAPSYRIPFSVTFSLIALFAPSYSWNPV